MVSTKQDLKLASSQGDNVPDSVSKWPSWAKPIAAFLLSVVLLLTQPAADAFADPDGSTPTPTPAPSTDASPSSSASPSPSPNPSVSLSVTSSAAPLLLTGVAAQATGTLTGFSGKVTVRAQALVKGEWVDDTSVVTSERTYKVGLRTGASTAGTYRFRVQAVSAQGEATSAEFSIQRVNQPTITASAPVDRRVGAELHASGKLTGFLPGKVTIQSQVQVNGKWRNDTRVTVSSRNYSVALTYNSKKQGTYRWRIVATQGVLSTTSGAFIVNRVPHRSVTVKAPSSVRTGASLSATGTILGYSGKVTLQAQVLVNGKWIIDRTKTLKASHFGTSYSIPLTYRAGKAGTQTWRMVVTNGTLVTQSSKISTKRVSPSIDSRCLTGRAICISKKERKLRWVVNGTVKMTLDARFGSTRTPTRNGAFKINWKSRNHVSSLYHTPMPFAMFFSGGQAVHYSADFAARGYSGASHGCVNIRDRAAIQSLFNQARVGDKVIVY